MERRQRTFRPTNRGTNVGLLAIGGLILAALILLVVLYTTTNHITDTSVRLFKVEVTDETILRNNIQLNGTTICSQPVDGSCLPLVTTYNDIEINNLNLTGTTTCTNPTDLNCIPPIPTAKLQCDAVLPIGCLGSGMGIDNSMCTVPVQLSCIPLIPSMKIQDAAITEQKLASNSVSTVKIQDNAISTDKIQDGSVTEQKLASNSVSTVKIQDNSVTEQKLASNSVSTVKIQDGAVTEQKLASNSVSTIKIQDGAVTEQKLASNSISTVKIQNGAVTNDKLATGTISSSKLSCDAALAPACISLDSETCTNPVDISCVPAIPTSQLLGTISNTQLAGGITSDKMSCSSELGANCIPKNLTFTNLVVQNLTAIDFVHVNMMDINETMITVNMLDVETITLSNTMTCNAPAKIDINCMPPIPANIITGTIVTSQIAPGAVDDSKISGVASTKISGLIPTTQLSGTITNTQLGGGITSGKLACDAALAPACVSLDGETCTSPVDLSCVPAIPTTQLSGTVTNAQLAGGITSAKLACDTDLAASCIKIDGETCTAPVGLSCIPTIPTTQLSGTVTNAQLAGGITSAKLACDTDLAASCIKIDSETCAAPVGLSCIPTIPTTQLSGTITNTQLAGGITSAKLACDADLAPSCIKIDSETCTLPVDLSCVPAIPTTQLSGTITNAQLAGGITSAKMACDVPLAPACVPSGATKYATEFTWGFQALPLTPNIWPGNFGVFTGSAVGSCPITIPTTGTYLIEYQANQIWKTAPPEGSPTNWDGFDVIVLFIGTFNGFTVSPIAGTEHLPIFTSQFIKTPLPFPVVPIKSWEGMVPFGKTKSGSRILALTAGTNLCLGLAFGTPSISGFGIFSQGTKLRVTEL